MEAGDARQPPSRRRERRALERRRRELHRRRLLALAAVAALAAIGGAAIGADGDGEPTERAAAIPAQCAGSGPAATRSLAGQRLVVRTDGEPERALLARARAGEIAGVIVFPAADQGTGSVRRGIQRLQDAAAAGGQPPLLVATDQEGGPVKRFAEAPPQRSPLQLAELDDPRAARLEGRATGSFLAGLGVNTDLAPVLDVPVSSTSAIALRAFGSDAEQVSELGLAFATGLGEEGVLATAKHFPGLGRSTLNTDLSPSEVDASRRELREDLRPFEAAVAQDVPLVMVGLASYPALGSDAPAALSPEIVEGLLRERLGFEGLTISDDLQAGALAGAYSSSRAAAAAAEAGIDLLLFAGDAAPRVLGPLARALRTGKIDLQAAREACTRIVGVRESLPAPAG